MPTANVSIGPADGWTLLATTPKFVRVSAFPHTHPYYVYAGASPPANDATLATGTVIFAAGVPIANETVTIGTEVYTFKASRVNPFEVTIGATNLLTSANFATAVNADSLLVRASNSSGTVTVTSYVAGTAGNYAMSETATNVTVGGATMTGGANKTIGVLMVHKPFWNNVTMTENLYGRVITPVPNSTNSDGKLRLDVLTV